MSYKKILRAWELFVFYLKNQHSLKSRIGNETVENLLSQARNVYILSGKYLHD